MLFSCVQAGATMTRFITPGSRLDVWLEMQLADDDATNGDIFQVSAHAAFLRVKDIWHIL